MATSIVGVSVRASVLLVALSVLVLSARPHGEVSERAVHATPSRPAHVERPLDRLPLAFEPVASDDGPRFRARTPGYQVVVGPDAFVAVADTGDARPAPSLHFTLLGANPAASPVRGRRIGSINYLLGPRHRWTLDRSLHDRIEFREVYPSVDLAYYGSHGRLEHDFVVRPGGTPRSIALRLEGVRGARVADDGALTAPTPAGDFRLEPPVVYQDAGSERVLIAARYAVVESPLGALVTFAVGPYDVTRPLVIDPVLSYALTLGGSGYDEVADVAVDGTGAMYVVGTTQSTNFPTQAPGSASGGGDGDVFITKLAASGASLVFSTVIGGSGNDVARAIAVDAAGTVFVTGSTTSINFPLANAAQPTHGGSADAFVVRLAASGGGLLYSTYLGGLEIDEASDIAIDPSGGAYVVGTTFSSNFPVASARQAAYAGGTDAFVTKLNSSGGMVFSTYHGGSAGDEGTGIAVDAQGSATVVGATSSANFPLASAWQGVNRGNTDGFVSRLGPSGTVLMFSTFVGGTGFDAASSVAVDSAGRPHIAGSTLSADFPVIGPAFATHVGGFDAFYGVLTPTGVLSASTFLGGTGSDRARRVVVDSANRAIVIGQTTSSDMPMIGALQPANGGGRDAFLALFGFTGSSVVVGWTTYYGAAHDDDAQGVAVDLAGRVTVVGALTYASAHTGGASDGFLARLSNGDGTTDTDGDGMPDEWETQFNLDALSASDASSDPDGDGKTNLQEYQAGTHPNGRFSRYLAEGATSAFFSTALAVANPASASARVLFRFIKSDGTAESRVLFMAPMARATLDVASVAGMAAAEFSTVVESDVAVVVDRTMYWAATGASTFYGSHAETASESPATTWYLAEGATHGSFDLFYLVQNPGDAAATVDVTYLLPEGRTGPTPPIVKRYSVAPRTRFNIWVDREAPALAATDVSAKIVSVNNVPILVERAMYMRAGNLTFGAGHASAAVSAPGTSWFLAEGATGNYFDLFVLVANPNTAAADIRATYLLPDGSTIVKTHTVKPQSRFNIWVDQQDARLADTAVSTIIDSTNGVPIIVERAMWWPGPTSATWIESHNSFGSTVTGTKWALGEGERGGPRRTESYVLVANTSTFAGQVRVTLMFEDDGSRVERTYAVAARSRTNVQIAADFPAATGRRFSTIVESLGSQKAQIVVERAMYSNAGATVWAAGTNALATRLAP